MNHHEADLLRHLTRQLETVNAYRFADATTRPNYPAYLEAKASARRRVRQTIRDIRHWRAFLAA